VVRVLSALDQRLKAKLVEAIRSLPDQDIIQLWNDAYNWRQYRLRELQDLLRHVQDQVISNVATSIEDKDLKETQ